MRNLRIYALLILACFVSIFISGCGSGSKSLSGDKTLKIGSGVYAETWLMAELVKIMLEEKGGFRVENVQNFSGATLLHNATLSGDLDGYVSHSGTQFTGILEMEVTDEWKDRAKVFDYCRKQFDEKYKMTWFDPFGFNDTYAITVRKDFAEKNNLKKISDLKPLASTMTIGTDQTFQERIGDGYKGFTQAYGLTFKEPVAMEYNLIYSALANKSVDAIVAYSTDGRIASLGLAALEDDKNFFPPYDGALIMAKSTLEKYPEITSILKPLWGVVDDEAMASMNAKVDVEEKEFTEVAREFLKSEGLI